MRHVTCRVPETAVAPICEQGMFAPWKRLARRRRAAASSPAARGTYPRVERIWFPYYLFSIEVTSRKGPGEMLVTVEAWSGAFAIFQLEEFLVEGTPTDGDIFPHRLDVETCALSARQDLLHTIMRQRSRIGGKPLPGSVTSREAILYPLWVYYYHRRKNMLDIKVVDGASGRLVGHKSRAAVLDAFLAQKAGDAGATSDGGEEESGGSG